MKPGDMLAGKYKIETELGRGSFGAVYRAVQEPIGRLVAIKVLTPKGKLDDEMKKRFMREAKLSSHLKSNHCIKIHDFGDTDGQMYIVMEYLEGQPLDVLLRQTGKLPPKRVSHIIRQVLDSLGEAHQLGIVHRDLKPDNIFVCNNATQTDVVKVFDFGIAKVVGGSEPGSLKETQKLTMVGGTVGTPAYMSPEQCCGEKLTPASDFYSLGVVMYEMLTGIIPFEDANPVRTMMRQINEYPPPLADDVASTAVGQATMRALEKQAGDRFQTAQEFLDALKGDEADSVSSSDLFFMAEGGREGEAEATERVLPVASRPPGQPVSQAPAVPTPLPGPGPVLEAPAAAAPPGNSKVLVLVAAAAVAVALLLMVVVMLLFVLKG